MDNPDSLSYLAKDKIHKVNCCVVVFSFILFVDFAPLTESGLALLAFYRRNVMAKTFSPWK